MDFIIFFGIEKIGGFGLFFLWASDPIFIDDSFSLSKFNQSGFFVFVSQENLWVLRLRFAFLETGLVVGFMGLLGLVVLLEIQIWF